MERFRISFSEGARAEAGLLDPQRRVLEAIDEKLAVDPERFGKPLRNALSGIRSLRVGDWRITFSVDRDIVRILTIFHRSKGYRS